MKIIDLNGKWNGQCYKDGNQDFTFAGSVPGCVHTDLMGNKIPSDIYYRDNADKCQWIEDCDWKYERSFTLESTPQNAFLVFEGLDTYADIYLNGNLIGKTENMFVRHEFPVSELLTVGENTVSVYFRSPIREVSGKEERPAAFTCERLHTRRIQCTYGWDWVARFVTCGIWRDAYIEERGGFDVKKPYIYTEVATDTWAQIVVEAETVNYENGGYYNIAITDPSGKEVYDHRFYTEEPSFKHYINIRNAELWYPLGYGNQPIYTLSICGKEYKFGIRTAVIEELPDEIGSPYYDKCLELKETESGREYDKTENFSGFRLLINGKPIMCKGANWVPCEPFPSAESDEKITSILSLAREAGVNMLRVWGGGIFEKEHFYDECDRLGILLSQDFLMACGHYPEKDESFLSHVRAEVEFAARELRNHPSLVWWSGDNENAAFGYDDSEDYWGRNVIHKAIMPMLLKHDPRRRFLLSSPYGGNVYACRTSGTTHNTQSLGFTFPYVFDTDMEDYKEYFSSMPARFMAEEPTMGATSLPSLRKFMTESDIYDESEMWEYHTKPNPTLPFTLFEFLNTFTHKVLGEYKDGFDRFFKLKYAQYEWVRVTLENARRNRGFMNGMIYWMWNDCWPASSGWSFVDYYCLPKASYYSFKRCASQLVVSIDKSDKYDIYLCNDGFDKHELELSLSYIKDGKVVHVENATASIGAQSSECVYSLPLDVLPDGAMLICDARSDNFSTRAFYKSGKLPIVPCSAPEIIAQNEDSITLRAKEYIHALELDGEYVFDDNYFSLMPNETRTVNFRPLENAMTKEITVVGYTVK